MSDCVLSVRDLVVRLGDAEILRGIDLDVAPGRIVGVLGPNGAGKSTLFRTIAGEVMPSRGQVRIANRDVTREPLWRRARAGLGYVPQTPSVLFDLSVADNIRTFERAVHAPEAVDRRASSVELQLRLHVRASELSGGERRRLELLRALIASPKLLICDEPFAGVAPSSVPVLARLITEARDNGAAVVLADHRVADILAVCDDAVLLVDGRVVVTTPAAEFATHPDVVSKYLT